jgi:hypothetical protein
MIKIDLQSILFLQQVIKQKEILAILTSPRRRRIGPGWDGFKKKLSKESSD